MTLIGGSWRDDVKGEEDGPLIDKSWVDKSDDPHFIPPPPVEQVLDQMTNQERLIIFDKYCRDCGGKLGTSCNCRH